MSNTKATSYIYLVLVGEGRGLKVLSKGEAVRKLQESKGNRNNTGAFEGRRESGGNDINKV